MTWKYSCSIIYSIKSIRLTALEENGLREVVLFVVLLFWCIAWIEVLLPWTSHEMISSCSIDCLNTANSDTVDHKLGKAVLKVPSLTVLNYYFRKVTLSACVSTRIRLSKRRKRVVRETKRNKTLDRIRWKPEDIPNGRKWPLAISPHLNLR